MILAAWVAKKSPKAKILGLIFAALVIGLVVSLLLAGNSGKTRPVHLIDGSITPQQLIASSNQAAQVALKSKDYQTAEDSYMQAASIASSNGDYNQAKNLLLTAIAKIPDGKISWSVYDSLVVLAQQLKDQSLERTSLQKALAKAELPGSDAPLTVIDYYRQQLNKLGGQ